MKKLSLFIIALTCASMTSFAQENFALATAGSSATASSGTAASAIDGNDGTRWESAATDSEWFLLNLGQSRTFNYIKIKWENAYAKQFQLLASADGESFSPIYTETALGQADWQAIYLETPVTAQYIKYQGIERATQWGQSFWEFQVFYLNEPPRAFTLITPLTISASSEGYNDIHRLIDGNAGTEWQGSVTNGTEDTDEARTFDAWFVVDLGGFYTIEKVDIVFEGACAQDYHIDFSDNNLMWELGYNFIGQYGIHGRTDEIIDPDNGERVRYIRFWSTKAATQYGMKIFEFRVFGRPWEAPAGDIESPVMVSATLDSKDWRSAVIAVEATDDGDIARYHVVDAAHGIDARCTPQEGKIIINGLEEETAYVFTITAIDAAYRESDNSVELEVTTPKHLLVPVVAAPIPTWPAVQVKSFYSDAYTFAPTGMSSYNEGWWNNPNMEEEAIGEDHYLHYELYREGMIGVQFQETSVAKMEKFHIDIFASAGGSLTLRLICADDPEEINQTKQTLRLVSGEWNSFDFDLADFNAAHNWARFFQYAIEGYKAGGLVDEHISIDNIYFYTTQEPSDDGIQATKAATKSAKMIRNGQLIIIRGEKAYSILGNSLNN